MTLLAFIRGMTKVGLYLTEDIPQRTRGWHPLRHREGKPVGLPFAVVGVLPQHHHTHPVPRGGAQCGEDLTGRGIDHTSFPPQRLRTGENLQMRAVPQQRDGLKPARPCKRVAHMFTIPGCGPGCCQSFRPFSSPDGGFDSCHDTRPGIAPSLRGTMRRAMCRGLHTAASCFRLRQRAFRRTRTPLVRISDTEPAPWHPSLQARPTPRRAVSTPPYGRRLRPIPPLPCRTRGGDAARPWGRTTRPAR